MSERVTVGGVDAPCDKAKLSDMRFAIMLGELDDPELSDDEKLSVVARLTRYLFGSERYALMDRLAEEMGGNLAPDEFSKWLGLYLAEVGAKN